MTDEQRIIQIRTEFVDDATQKLRAGQSVIDAYTQSLQRLYDMQAKVNGQPAQRVPGNPYLPPAATPSNATHAPVPGSAARPGQATGPLPGMASVDRATQAVQTYRRAVETANRTPLNPQVVPSSLRSLQQAGAAVAGMVAGMSALRLLVLNNPLTQFAMAASQLADQVNRVGVAYGASFGSQAMGASFARQAQGQLAGAPFDLSTTQGIQQRLTSLASQNYSRLGTGYVQAYGSEVTQNALAVGAAFNTDPGGVASVFAASMSSAQNAMFTAANGDTLANQGDFYGLLAAGFNVKYPGAGATSQSMRLMLRRQPYGVPAKEVQDLLAAARTTQGTTLQQAYARFSASPEGQRTAAFNQVGSAASDIGGAINSGLTPIYGAVNGLGEVGGFASIGLGGAGLLGMAVAGAKYGPRAIRSVFGSSGGGPAAPGDPAWVTNLGSGKGLTVSQRQSIRTVGKQVSPELAELHTRGLISDSEFANFYSAMQRGETSVADLQGIARMSGVGSAAAPMAAGVVEDSAGMLSHLGGASRLAGPLVGAGLAGVGIWQAMQAGQPAGHAIGEGVGSAAGGWGGWELGAAAGAGIGTALFPGVGTVLGGVAGGLLGGWAGSTVGGGVGGWLGDQFGPQQTQVASAQLRTSSSLLTVTGDLTRAFSDAAAAARGFSRGGSGAASGPFGLPFSLPFSLPFGGGSSSMDNATVSAYVTQAARIRGIDPTVAMQVLQHEGGLSPSGWVGDSGTSFGPYQLHVGGGWGDSFKATTGLDPSDLSTWKQQVDYALSQVAQGGWDPGAAPGHPGSGLHGATAAGISNWQGITPPASSSTMQPTSLHIGSIQTTIQVATLPTDPAAIKRFVTAHADQIAAELAKQLSGASANGSSVPGMLDGPLQQV